MSANQLINQKLYEIYKLTDIEEILQIRTMDLSMLKNLYNKDIIMKLIINFITIKNISPENIENINVYVSEIYDLLLYN